MTPNNNLSVLPFYNSIGRQNHRKSYAFGAMYPLFSPMNTILPFQIIRPRPTATNPITAVNLKDKDGNQIADITSTMVSNGLVLKQFSADGYDIIYYPGNMPISFQTSKGYHYLEIVAGDTYYSEMFTFVDNIERYLKIQWWDAENLYFESGHIDYTPPFRNTLYLKTELGKPEYPFEEQGSNRDGFFFPEKQISEKTYKFVFLAPEYLLDAIRVARMSDAIRITSMGQVYNCDTFLITPTWETQGDLASVEAEFECATIVKKVGRGVVLGDLGDFNDDFSNDFNN